MNKKCLWFCQLCLFLVISAFSACKISTLGDGDFLYLSQTSGQIVPNMVSSREFVIYINENFVDNGSNLRVCFDGPDCNLYRLDYLRAGKKETPIPCADPVGKYIPFTKVLKRICEAYGLESDRKGNVFHLKKKESRIVLEAEYEKESASQKHESE